MGPESEQPWSSMQYGTPVRKKAVAKPLDFAVLALLPWIIFSLIVSLYAFAYEDFSPLVWALVGISALLALLFLSMGCASGKAAQMALGILVLTAVGISVPVGTSVQRRFMTGFWEADSGAEYRSVSPLDPAAAHRDASVLAFERGTVVDGSRSIGYMQMGEVYCVAPILGAAADLGPVAVQYWAVGRNCCGPKGTFLCADSAGASDGFTGIVASRGVGEYEKAVRMATAAYGILPNTGPNIFVQRTDNATAYKAHLWDRAVTSTVMASGIYFVGSCGASVILGRGLMR